MPHNCNQSASLIKYNRILLKDELVRSTRVHMSTGKKMEAAHPTKLILCTDCLLVCFVPSSESLELDGK